LEASAIERLPNNSSGGRSLSLSDLSSIQSLSSYNPEHFKHQIKVGRIHYERERAGRAIKTSQLLTLKLCRCAASEWEDLEDISVTGEIC